MTHFQMNLDVPCEGSDDLTNIMCPTASCESVCAKTDSSKPFMMSHTARYLHNVALLCFCLPLLTQ